MIALAQQSNILDEVIHGEALAVLRTLPDNSVDAIVCDPPAGISFMGKEWDKADTFPLRDRGKLNGTPAHAPHAHERGFANGMHVDNSTRARDAFISFLSEIMAEALRALKPGGHAFVWALPRTSHWTGIALEDAGFEIRDVITHLFGSGFPKSMDVSKAIDKRGGAQVGWFGPWLRQERERRGINQKELAQHFPSKTGGMTGCIANWELGLNLPTVEQFNKLCEVLNLPFQRLEEAEREVIGKGKSGKTAIWNEQGAMGDYDITAPATPEASQWNGWGTSLKPASEHWWLCRKPLSEKNIAANILKWGTGAINIDASRVGYTNEADYEQARAGTQRMFNNVRDQKNTEGWARPWNDTNPRTDADKIVKPQGRWPANLLLSHSVWCVPNGVKKVRGNNSHFDDQLKHNGNGTRLFGQDKPHVTTHGYADSEGMEQVEDWLCDESCPIRLLDEQSGVLHARGNKTPTKQGKGMFFPEGGYLSPVNSGDSGGSSRYFQRFYPFIYQAKASRSERNRGCEGLPEVERSNGNKWTDQDYRVARGERSLGRESGPRQNIHPTVKPIQLMRYLVRMITPPGGTVLDCFAGSGSTLVAAIHEGMHFIGIEMNDTPEEPYCTIARARIEQAFREVQS